MKKYILFLCSVPLFSASVWMYNDSPFPLNAQLIAADGTDLGTATIFPQHEFKWQDSNQNVQTFSQTPFTVIWFCKDGQEYGLTDQVQTGATVTAQGSVGRRYCRPEKKNPNPK